MEASAAEAGDREDLRNQGERRVRERQVQRCVRSPSLVLSLIPPQLA